MAKLEKRKLERVRYWQGQMLRSRDFRSIEDVESQRRWWHNRALHNAYGVAEGFDCELVPASASAPAAVSVSPGVAYDVFGRELILESPQTITLPPNVMQTAAGTRLIVRYKGHTCGLQWDEVSEVCWAQNGAMHPGTVELAWKLTNDFAPKDGVAICGVPFSGTPLTASLDTSFVQLPTHPVARPLLASGNTIPGNTAWQPWTFGPITLGVQTWIDTSAAGFTRVPCYFAWLQGLPWHSQTQALISVIYPSITDEATTGFTFRLWLPFPYNTDRQARFGSSAETLTRRSELFNEFSLSARQRELYVSWVACQMPVPLSRCEVTPAPAVEKYTSRFNKA